MHALGLNKWVQGSSEGFPVPWVVRDMEAALGDVFVLNVCSIHRGGGLPMGVPPTDEISQKRNNRWVGFMLLSTPPFWVEDPSMTLEAPEVAHCGIKSCRKRPNSICHGCKKKIVCTTHRTQLCMSCDAPVAPWDVPSSSIVPTASGVTNGTNGTVPIDSPFTCFFPVNTSTVHLMWLPKKPRMHKPGDAMECPCWEAMHGTGEIGSPTPDSYLLRIDAGSVLVLRHGRCGVQRFAVSGDKKVEVFGWYMVPTDHTMVDMSILLRLTMWGDYGGGGVNGLCRPVPCRAVPCRAVLLGGGKGRPRDCATKAVVHDAAMHL